MPTSKEEPVDLVAPNEPYLPYGRHMVSEDDIRAVADVLRGDWLTTGPPVERFEKAFAEKTGAEHAVAFANGTAALHGMYVGAGIGPGDEVIVPAMTFVATANAALYCGARPIIADVDPETLLLTTETAARHITQRTKAIVAVDYAGQPCDYRELSELAEDKRVTLLSDACHALGGTYHGKPVGTLAAGTTFSFHPVKHITTGEGGMVTTEDIQRAERMRTLRNHGIAVDAHARTKAGAWHYDMGSLGNNYRLSGIHAALGTAQLAHLDGWVARRRQLAARYDKALQRARGVTPLHVLPDRTHAYHLYVVRITSDGQATSAREHAFRALREKGIGANVHYRPVHLHSYYRDNLGTRPGDCPVAEAASSEILSLPLWPGMRDTDVDRVVAALVDALEGSR